jgi:hypothetical protein
MTALFVGLLSLASFYLLYSHRGLVVGHDLVLEIVRLVETKQALLGQIYPRLAPDLYFGYGSPFFVYYPPLFLLLTNLVDPPRTRAVSRRSTTRDAAISPRRGHSSSPCSIFRSGD